VAPPLRTSICNLPSWTRRAMWLLPSRKSTSNWWFQPLWKILVRWDDYSQYMGK
jgi:hypothetical protein